jgi:hypothetical protein
MIYIYLSQFLFSFGLAIAIIKIRNKQEKEYRHLLNNLKYIENLIKKDNEK